MNDDLIDRLAIRQLVEGWALLRDARQWDRFRTVWHDDGVMQATWFQGTRDDFIKVSEEGYAKGVRILHFLGGSTVDVAGTRAIAQTKMTISQRAKVEDVLCDVVCTGRFYDFFEKRGGRWGLVLRQPIYEKDRLAVSGRLPASGLSADADWLQGKARYAGAGGPGAGGAVCTGREVAEGGEAVAPPSS
jgi:hypothetical protein